MSQLCVPIMVQETASALADAHEAKRFGADLVEFRLDEFFDDASDESQVRRLVRLVSDSPLPCIATCRLASEGGSYDGDEDARVALFERLGTAARKGEHPPRYLDIEHAAYSRSANLRQKVHLALDFPDNASGTRREHRASLILSLHDFSGRPQDLLRRVAQMNEVGPAAVVKIATRARSLRDSLELLDLAANAHKPTIALGIGEFGLISRILAPKFGGFLTFASLRPTTVTAPGQPTIRELVGDRAESDSPAARPVVCFRFRSISKLTRVYGIIGWPVGHSLSPLLHNAGFGAANHDAVYLPLPVAGGEDADASYASFKATLGELADHPRLDFSGCSVTAPHKENLVRFARERGWRLDEASQIIGAGNTLILERRDGAVASARVINTDAPAAVAWIEASLGSLSSRSVLLLGAGGVARAIAYSAALAGARVRIQNRTPARAARLAADLNDRLRSFGTPPIEIADENYFPPASDCIINCTPAGMHGGEGESVSPMPEAEMATLPRETLALDSVYNPLETPFLRIARASALRAAGGDGFFVRQAELQFEAWTGNPPILGLYERLVRDSLRRLP